MSHLARPFVAALIAISIGVGGCSTAGKQQSLSLQSQDEQLRLCAQWFLAFDQAVSEFGVSDFAARRIPGFPYLRVDRFTASFSDQASEDPRLRKAWITRMRALDAEGRRIELNNLPDDALLRLGEGTREQHLSRADECARKIGEAELAEEANIALLVIGSRVEDDYSALKRAVGLYGLTAVPFASGIENWQRKTVQAFEAAAQGVPAIHPVIRYVPPASGGMTRAEVAALLARAAAEPMGIPRLTPGQRERLFATYAPVLEIETSGDFDRIGRLYWSDQPALQVDISAPTMYRHLAFARVGTRTLLQLVYTVWMPERPQQGNFDLLAGHLDGIVWRVTLAPDAEPVLFDSIHPCGCYHMFFPTPRAAPLPAPEPYIEWAFSPASLPAIQEGQRVNVRAESRTHYLNHVWSASGAEGVSYAFAEYDELRSLALPAGGARSAFGPDGLVPGTERGERYLFWPMGIASPGAMRQWGSQPTAFVGRRHFDDPDLFERRFRFVE